MKSSTEIASELRAARALEDTVNRQVRKRRAALDAIVEGMLRGRSANRGEIEAAVSALRSSLLRLAQISELRTELAQEVRNEGDVAEALDAPDAFSALDAAVAKLAAEAETES